MGTQLVTAAQTEPVSIDEIKEHLCIETNDYDSQLSGLIQEGRRYVEQHTGRALITQTWNLKLDAFQDKILVPYPPLQSISSITYQDLDNATQTLASTIYIVDTSEEPARLNEAYGEAYPSTYPDLNSVTIQFVAGYGDYPEDIPERFKRAIKLYVSWMFDDSDMAKTALKSIVQQDKVNWF